MNDIDVVIFDFVAKISEKAKSNEKETPSPEMHGVEPIIHLGEVQNLSIEGFDESDYSPTSKFIDIDGKMVGLNEDDFSSFKQLVLLILDEPPFDSMADPNFIIQESFKWLTNVYRNKRAETNLTNYLLWQVSASVKDFHFYFRVLPLSIESKFSVGDTEITYFTQEEIEQHYTDFLESKPETSLKEFKELYRMSGIHAHVQVKGIPSRAEEVAKRKAELAIDVLKCFCTDFSIEHFVQIFDLDYRLTRKGQATFLNLPEGKIRNSTIQFRNTGGMVPIDLTNERLQKFRSTGLNTLSAFIKEPKINNDLYDEIISLVNQLATIISTHSNYEKVVKSISLIESFLLPKPSTGKAKGLTRIKKALPKIINNQKDQEILSACFVKFYEIRDKYLHNFIQLPLAKSELFYLLEFQRIFILKLIEYNKSMSEVEQVHKFLGLI